MLRAHYGDQDRASVYHCLVMLSIGFLMLAVGCTPSTANTIAAPSSPTHTAVASAPNAGDTEFQAMLGVRIEPLAQLRTDKQVYARGEILTFWVYNRTDTTIYYADQSFSLKGYVYDATMGHWRQVDLGFHDLNNWPISIPPEQHDELVHFDTFGGPVEEFDQVGKIRLAVVGWTDPANPEGSQVASYTDIEIR